MLSGREIVSKADMVLSELTSGGGVLLPEQAQQFMRQLIEESRLFPLCNVKPMAGPKLRIDQIGFGSRVLHGADAGSALGEDKRSKPTFDRVELDAQLLKAEVRIPYEALEDNIEKEAMRQTIIELMSKRVRLDAEDLVINGDTTTYPTPADDSLYYVLDGLIVQAMAAGNTVNKADAYIDKGLLRDMLLKMPHVYIRDKRMMRLLTSMALEIRYRDSLAERADGRADLEQDRPVVYSGVPMIDIGTIPENVGTSNHCSVILLTDPKNIVIGIERNILVETDKDISAGEYIIVVTMRMDVKFAVSEAVVIAYNVKV